MIEKLLKAASDCNLVQKECSCGKGQCVTCILAGEIRRRDADIIKLKAELAEARNDIDNAVRCAKKYQPDYPWKLNTASEAVWACGEAFNGVSKACDSANALIEGKEIL